ncbi:MAG: hypothetical protein B6D72_16935 [gamma proteobacterium symbiont of Ctena orbiculata]|uniref:Uncharacterized protein n=1 Tax=Candidatus Thiodiazotropha taylori TaxID=2792791 RepID=A0A944MA28_9GAMM|nr:hypothetical protein [Candidatus Thiodiazotropha taylori]PUB90090.1 MAG: hypothetical protein DBP00_00705 [gamma proteobacterium symbiont of Ctena orbiculata]MBT2990746.1 hypothetical protein [Candidatus Thiodiazotropha taylori]MBT2996633.1 hypothetical protein [Candidatus Thiodiazotropha taylori]MBT3000673.1 hypothetical protein [Candidatus Thiodiazotropha taylori]
MLQRGDRNYYRETLAWARLDVDLERNEVLIEEVQSDWVRDMAWLQRWLNRCDTDEYVIQCYAFRTTAASAAVI